MKLAKKATRPGGRVAKDYESRFGLEGQPQAELDLPLRAQRVHARAVADSELLLIRPRGSVDGACAGAEQDTVHRVWWQVEVGEVEEVVEADVGFDGKSLRNRVPPCQLQVSGAQPTETNLTAGRVSAAGSISRRRRAN